MQLFEGLRKLGKRRAIPQGAWLSLQDRQVVPPIVDGVTKVVPAIYCSLMFGDDLAFSGNDQVVSINAQTDRTIGK